MPTLDRHGRSWPGVTTSELCPECGQPDNCGDCTHGALTTDDVLLLGGLPNPRKNADDAYAAFMSMSPDEFRDCVFSLLRGGCLEPQEQIGFERALADRPPHPDSPAARR